MKKLILYVMPVFFVLACSKKNKYWEKSDHASVIQVMELNQEDATSGQEFRVRIFPKKGKWEKTAEEVKKSMWYKMDSSFYLKSAQGRIYPQGIEPVSNGVPGSFEYMVLFDSDKESKDRSAFIYDDLYLGGKEYTFD